jgi:histidinol dehydrogenase
LKARCRWPTASRPSISSSLDDPEALLTGIRNAGSVFLGRHTPEVIGDYVGGSNHVLPTARSARFSSGLSVLDYMSSACRC